MIKSHVSALLTKHAKLDQQLAAESHRPHPDSQHIAALKKQKLRLKDALFTG